MQGQLSSSIARCATAIQSALILLVLSSTIAHTAPARGPNSQNNGNQEQSRHRLLHHDSGRFITIDPSTALVTATSSVYDDTTLFKPFHGSPSIVQYESVIPALYDHHLSLVKEGNSTYFAVHNPESSGSSGNSSGIESASGSGSGDMRPKSFFYKWQKVELNTSHNLLKVIVDGQDCYLAFEETGEPVSDPCSISESDTRAAINIG